MWVRVRVVIRRAWIGDPGGFCLHRVEFSGRDSREVSSGPLLLCNV